ncbi:MAG: hypothetical protein HKN23_02430 [Verrucomicrobiales bacterium]|nr:hypothetical protein [Verrucomicrobiales bacterium]
MKKQTPSSSRDGQPRLRSRMALIALAATALFGLSSCHYWHGHGGYHSHWGGHYGGSYYGDGGGYHCY